MTQSFSYQNILFNQISIPTKLLTHYKKMQLTETDIVVILQLYAFLQDDITFPTPVQLAERLTISETEVMGILRKLIQKQLLTIDELNNEHNQLSEAYNLNPLWNELFSTMNEKQQLDEENEATVFILFEQEFGRLLSPFEIETINVWIDEDKMKPALIKAALREAVLMGKLNFKYIDRILREWSRKGIRSVEQAREEGRSFRQNQPKTKKEVEFEQRDTSVYFNWLEGEKN